MMSENTFSANTAEISGKPAGFMTRQKTLLRHRLWLPAMILLSYFICYVIYPWLMFANEGASVAERIYRAQQILGYNNFAVLMLTTIFAAVLGIQGYAYLHQRQMVDFYEAQPLKRNKRFWDIYVNSVLIWFICFLVMSAAGLGICAMYGAVDGYILRNFAAALIVNLGLFLAYLGIAVFAVMLTGRVVLSVLGFGVLCVYEFVIRMIYYYSGSAYWTTFYGVGNMLQSYRLTPINNVYNGRIGLVWNLALAVIMILLAYLIYTRRPNEAAGGTVVFKTARWIIKVGLVFPVAYMALYLLEVEVGLTGALPVSAFFALVAGCIVQIIYDTDFKALFKGLLPTGIGFVLTLIVFFAFYLDLTGYNSWLPSMSQVDHIAVSRYYGDGRYLEDGRAVNSLDYANTYMALSGTDAETALALAQSYIDEHDSDGYLNNDTHYVDLVFAYHMNNGKVIYRHYYISENGNEDLLDALIGSSAFKKGYYQIYHDTYMRENTGSMALNYMSNFESSDYEEYLESETLRISGEDYEALRSAIIADLEDMDYRTARAHQVIGCLHITYDADNGQYVSANVYDDFDQTIAWLESKGITVSRNVMENYYTYDIDDF